MMFMKKEEIPWGEPWGSLREKQIAIVVGHQPGGGAAGERNYNLKVANHMRSILATYGAEVFVYEHSIKSYGARQRAMKAAVAEALPECFIVFELHYDGYLPRPEAAGHHFKFRGAEALAKFTQQEWVRRFPRSRPRFDNGIHHCTSGNGSGFLKEAPGWAILTEPFFITNAGEKAFFANRHKEIADVYCHAAARFAELKGRK